MVVVMGDRNEGVIMTRQYQDRILKIILLLVAADVVSDIAMWIFR